MSLLLRVARFAQRHALWRPDTRVIAAVSGGSDSVALVCLLRDLHARNELILQGVAHLNHQIRGEASDEDEAFCCALAQSLAVPFHSARVDVPAAARRHRASLEVTARHARRQFFARVTQTGSGGCVATAHTHDDQAETVLLRMMRGTATRGLAGIASSRDGQIRPLLACSRQELRAELTARHQPWREDATNADIANPRNRVRHELLPYLERHFNPSVRQALVRLAELARADDSALSREAAAAAFHVLHTGAPRPSTLDVPTLHLDAEKLNALSDAVAGRLVQYALVTVADGGSFGIDDVEAVRAVAAGDRGAAALSGVRVEHSRGSVVLLSSDPARSPAQPFRFNLPVPGAVQAPDAGWVLEAEGPRARHPDRTGRASSDEVEIDASGLSDTLIVRSRLPGDRIRPLGLGGQKKLQDVFVDRKISRYDRDRVPLVIDNQGRIVWVAGHVLGEDFRVTDHTKAVIILKLRRMERLGT